MKGDWVKRGSPNAPVLVFIHGVLSNGESCWRHPSGAYWPDIVAKDPEMSDLGVYVFSYRTGFLTGNYGLDDAANALKEHFSVDGITGSKELVFVCHSMGGIVARRYLVARAAELIDRQVQVALFLLASPSLGSNYADLVNPLARLFGQLQVAALCSTRSNAWLRELDHDFRNLKEQALLPIAGKELVEDRFIVSRWLFRKQVVVPSSGACYFAEPYKVPGSDHFSIVKIEDQKAIQHRQLKRFVAEWRRTRTKMGPSNDAPEKDRINHIELGASSSPISVDSAVAMRSKGQDTDTQPAKIPISAVEEAIAPPIYKNVEAVMGDPATRHFIDRFWDLDASDKREIALELGLISDEEVDLPEQHRYDVALTRASERNLFEQLEKMVQERE